MHFCDSIVQRLRINKEQTHTILLSYANVFLYLCKFISIFYYKIMLVDVNRSHVFLRTNQKLFLRAAFDERNFFKDETTEILQIICLLYSK